MTTLHTTELSKLMYDNAIRQVSQKHLGALIVIEHESAKKNTVYSGPIAEKFDNGNVWVMGRNQAYTYAEQFGYYWKASAEIWVKRVKWIVTYSNHSRTFFLKSDENIYQIARQNAADGEIVKITHVEG